MHVVHSRKHTETLHSATRLNLARRSVSTHQGCRLLFTKANKHILSEAGEAHCHVSQKPQHSLCLICIVKTPHLRMQSLLLPSAWPVDDPSNDQSG